MPETHGMKTSPAGVDVVSGADKDMGMNSKNPMFKLKTRGTTYLRMYKTKLSANINASQTTIPLASTTGFPSGLTRSPWIWIMSSLHGFTWEAVSYASVTAGSVFGGARGFKGGYAGQTAASADTVVVGYNEFTVSHGLSYPPVHFVAWDSGEKRLIPLFIDEFGFSYLRGGVTDSFLYAVVDYEDFNVSAHIPSGNYDQYDFIYHIMIDSILTPYY